MGAPPKSVIHINFVAGSLVFDARPIWTAIRQAEENGTLSSDIAESIHEELDETAVHLGTRHYLLKLAVKQLRAALTDLYGIVPEQWPRPVSGYSVVNGAQWDQVRDESLIAVEIFFFEFRAFLELLAKFCFCVLNKIGKAPPQTVQLASGETIEISTQNGRLRSHNFLRYICEKLSMSVDWFTFLAKHRNFFSHEGAPYCAIEDRLMIPKEYDLLIMRGNIRDFARANPQDYFRVSECQKVVQGMTSLSQSLQQYVIQALSEPRSRTVAPSPRHLRRATFVRKLGRSIAKSITAGTIAVAIALLTGYGLGRFRPLTKIAVIAFDVPTKLGDLTNGTILANHITDALREITAEYAPLYSSSESLQTLRRIKLGAQGIPVEPALEIKGINLQTVLIIWDMVRTHRIVVSGELLQAPNHLVLKARVQNRSPASVESTIQDIRKDLDHASLEVAKAIIKEVSPQALGLYYLREKNYEAAADVFLYWSQQNPNDIARHFYIGWAYSELGKKKDDQKYYDQALAEYRVALGAVPNADVINAIGRIRLREAESQRDEKRREELTLEAYRDFSRARVTLPDDPTIANNLGYALVVLGCPREGLSDLRRAKDLDPKYAGAWINYGDAIMDLRGGELERSLFPDCAMTQSIDQCRWSTADFWRGSQAYPK